MPLPILMDSGRIAAHLGLAVQRLANRYAQWYAPLAFAIAVGVHALTGDITRAITILIVFCPCALVLATPTAVIAGIGNAARRTVLIKGGGQFEAAGRVDVVAFDKTGTLTRGEPAVTDIVGLDGFHPATTPAGGATNPGQTTSAVLQLAAAAEALSEHPLGRAIVAEARRLDLELPAAAASRIVPGVGVEASVNGRRIFVGRIGNPGGFAGTLDPAAGGIVETLEAEGRTVLAVAADGHVVGVIGLSDTLRPGAADAVAAIRQNILLSVAVNLLAVILAGLGMVTPILGAVVHEASAMLVVVNAVRLMDWRPATTA